MSFSHTAPKPEPKTLWELRYIILDDLIFHDAPRKYMQLSRWHFQRAIPGIYRRITLSRKLLERIYDDIDDTVLRRCLSYVEVLVVRDLQCVLDLNEVAHGRKLPGTPGNDTIHRDIGVHFPNAKALEFPVSSFNAFSARRTLSSAPDLPLDIHQPLPPKPSFVESEDLPSIDMPLGTDDISIAKVLGSSCTEIIVRFDESPAYAQHVIGLHKLSQLVGRGIEILSFLLTDSAPSSKGTWTSVTMQAHCERALECTVCGQREETNVKKLPIIKNVFDCTSEPKNKHLGSLDCRMSQSLNRWVKQPRGNAENEREVEYHVKDAEAVRTRLFKKDPSLKWYHENGYMSFVELEDNNKWSE
ncbi:hypothetical protein L198_02938 [Cryptococcus wingfieldii CBS 7118]|uniref:Uncharacterized protein n=1 Tax=Cryptococcus wingfieldii CBS 7118 TaxID=1295528 RepID=A0A1E3JIE7_9TREE|nr:hypothetical protein L198_02938 [Cryptococcus wingfieldii CBS 7118]ODO00618.1 hypothetical protein L198_02938 [Cryptococcus wingfieldii CBS 7118]